MASHCCKTLPKSKLAPGLPKHLYKTHLIFCQNNSLLMWSAFSNHPCISFSAGPGSGKALNLNESKCWPCPFYYFYISQKYWSYLRKPMCVASSNKDDILFAKCQQDWRMVFIIWSTYCIFNNPHFCSIWWYKRYPKFFSLKKPIFLYCMKILLKHRDINGHYGPLQGRWFSFHFSLKCRIKQDTLARCLTEEVYLII